MTICLILGILSAIGIALALKKIATLQAKYNACIEDAANKISKSETSKDLFTPAFKHWLLAEGIYGRVLELTLEYRKGKPTTNIDNLGRCFLWHTTPEGNMYWYDLNKKWETINN